MDEIMRLNGLFSLLILTTLMTILRTVQCEVYTSIQWDPLNPIFKASQERNNTIAVMMSSKMNIICPNVATNLVKLNDPRKRDSLHENLWIVNEKAFDSCNINSSDPENRFLLSCNDPSKLKFKLLMFKKTSPIIGDLEFQNGKHYYFIATSNGSVNSLDNHADGHCKTHNMKLQIYICTGQNDAKCKTVQSVDSKGSTSSTPTSNEDEDKEEGKTAKSVKCFISARDKIWLIAVGVVVGVLLVMCLGCLVVTCFRRRRISKPLYHDEGDGNIPLNEKCTNNGV